jgi:hypothetical protein
MEHSRHAAVHKPMPHSLPPVGRWEQHLTPASPVPEVSGDVLSERQTSESPLLPGDIMLKIDLSALGNAALWIPSNNATYDVPCVRA